MLQSKKTKLRLKRIEQLEKLIKSGDFAQFEKGLQEKYPDLTISWMISNSYLVRAFKKEMEEHG